MTDNIIINDERNSNLIGIKDNANKLPMFKVLFKQFKHATVELVKRSHVGHKKYSDYDQDYQNFSRIIDPINSYKDALLRHMFELDNTESEIDNLSAIAWNAMAILELRLREINSNKQP